ncbi:Hint domain-containing protein [Microbulbifer sp. S227A]|uniref:Hint domain-containing protein n=1 Tax=Microbulbifer sp. S227A TaxID=3415131 RepID=UPI003C7A72C8
MTGRLDRLTGAAQETNRVQSMQDMLVSTPTGACMAAELMPGSRVITRDCGVQNLHRIARRVLSADEIDSAPQLAPIHIVAGALGAGLPERDMVLSPLTRVLVKRDHTALYFEDDTLLVPARNLVGLPGIGQAARAGVTYLHLGFEQHEVIRANGIWIECFQPDDPHVYGVGAEQREELFYLFPDLADTGSRAPDMPMVI